MSRSTASASLVPAPPGRTPNYWCTWAAQNYRHGQGSAALDLAELEGTDGAARARLALNESELLGADGWARRVLPGARSDLHLVLDDGWDVPRADTGRWYSSFRLDEEKFPTFARFEPAQRLRRLNAAVRAAGWRGLGLWLAAQEAEAAADARTPERYWRQRLRWCRAAGVEYWKVDWGAKSLDLDFRRMLTALAREEHPALVVEHAIGHLPFNDRPRLSPEWVRTVRSLAEFSAVVRLYDLPPQLSVPAMLDRLASVLAATAGPPAAPALLNCDDEPVLAAVLGACAGLMRHPLAGLRPGGDPDLFFSGPRRQKQRADEVTRALRWQRIAPAFADAVPVQCDAARLTDSWRFARGDFWWGSGELVEQTAPARVSRGLPLPVVRGAGEPPYTIASRHPNGAVAVATLGRMAHASGWSEPRANVTLTLGALPPALGIFGRFAGLTLRLAAPPPETVAIRAQDLAGDAPVEITARCRIAGDTLRIPGGAIDQVGLAAATPGDCSAPGLVVAFAAAP